MRNGILTKSRHSESDCLHSLKQTSELAREGAFRGLSHQSAMSTLLKTSNDFHFQIRCSSVEWDIYHSTKYPIVYYPPLPRDRYKNIVLPQPTATNRENACQPRGCLFPNCYLRCCGCAKWHLLSTSPTSATTSAGENRKISDNNLFVMHIWRTYINGKIDLGFAFASKLFSGSQRKVHIYMPQAPLSGVHLGYLMYLHYQPHPTWHYGPTNPRPQSPRMVRGRYIERPLVAVAMTEMPLEVVPGTPPCGYFQMEEMTGTVLPKTTWALPFHTFLECGT